VAPAPLGTGGQVPPPLSEVAGHRGAQLDYLNEGNQGCNSGRPLSRGLKSIIDRSPIYLYNNLASLLCQIVTCCASVLL
jgi:hypothetical protein